MTTRAFITRLDAPQAGRLRVAVKDLIDLAGTLTTNGSRVIAGQNLLAKVDAACLAGTRAAVAAGEAVIVGKTNLHELAFGVTGINPWFGTPVNPIDPGLPPGGSSSGSAVALAAGESDVAFGSDTGGSIRIPAACCAVTGLKTTHGRIPLEGVFPLAPSLDTVGPMARTVAETVAGMRLLEPGFSPAEPRPLVVGRVRLPAETWIDQDIDAALVAVDKLIGMSVIEVGLAAWTRATAATMTIMSAEAWQIHEGLWREHAEDLSPDVAARLELASRVTQDEVTSARQDQRKWEAELAEVFAKVDVLALPTLAAHPPSLDEAQRLSDIRYAAPFNLAGLPALALPVAASEPVPARGPVPASLQLVAPAGGEELLCMLGAAVEKVAGYRAAEA